MLALSASGMGSDSAVRCIGVELVSDLEELGRGAGNGDL